jgi:glutathione peroxidase
VQYWASFEIMKIVSILKKWFLLAAITSLVQLNSTADKAAKPEALTFKMKDIHGKDVNFESFKGKVVLAVNVASKCGFTPQYEGLESLYNQYKDDGFIVIGFPSNNFGEEEPGTHAEILEFCRINYQVTFPLMGKIDVQGERQSPFYKYLTSHADYGGPIKWNFEKFLIDRSGNVIGRFDPEVAPEDDLLKKAIRKALKT